MWLGAPEDQMIENADGFGGAQKHPFKAEHVCQTSEQASWEWEAQGSDHQVILAILRSI